MTNLQLHLLMMAAPIIALTWLVFDKQIRTSTMLILSGAVALCAVVAINALTANTHQDLLAAVVRSEIYSAALGEKNIVLLNREYRLVRVPKAEDDLDNDEVEDDTDGDGIPEIPL